MKPTTILALVLLAACSEPAQPWDYCPFGDECTSPARRPDDPAVHREGHPHLTAPQHVCPGEGCRMSGQFGDETLTCAEARERGLIR